MSQKGLWNLAKDKIMKERGELPNEEGDAVREYKAMHEENSLSNCPREDGRGKEERTAKVENNQGKSVQRGEERRKKEENKTWRVKRRCEGFVSVEAFEIFSQGGDLDSGGDLSWEDPLEKPEDLSDCEPETWVDVSVVLMPSSVITEVCDVLSCCSDGEYVEPQSFSFSNKACTLLYKTQEEERYESSRVKAPPMSRRRMMPLAPLHNSYGFLWRGAGAL